jgi:hypothetical protein
MPHFQHITWPLAYHSLVYKMHYQCNLFTYSFLQCWESNLGVMTFKNKSYGTKFGT